VQDNLYDANERRGSRFPRQIQSWVNFTAKDDFVAHDSTVDDDFAAMERKKFVGSIVDHKMRNFWVGNGCSNPHKLYGYLDNPKVAKSIADWM